jgi:drug/metabolite transporter (DMT)-like permease
MFAASAGVAGAAAMSPGAAEEASTDVPAAAAAGPTARLAGGTCNCESSADYTRGACDNSRVSNTVSTLRSANPYLLLTLTPLFWACNTIVGRGLAPQVPPMTMTFLRWLFAILILAPFAWPHVRRDWPVVRRNWKPMLVLGVIGVGIHNAIGYLGLNYTTATNALILNSFIPVMVISISWIFLRERLTSLQLAGVGVSLGGVLMILTRGTLDAVTSFRLNGGDLLLILAMALWSIYTIGLRWRPAGLHTLTFLFVLMVIGDLAVLPLFAAELAIGRHMAVTPANIAAIMTVALFSSVLAYIFWNQGVAQVGANVAGLFVHLMPVFGVLLAWVFLDERLALFHVAGIALILSGIAITSRLGRRSAPLPAGID